jgi:hypothetical protein
MPTYLLVAKRMGFTVADLDSITIGLFLDTCISSGDEEIDDSIDKLFPF